MTRAQIPLSVRRKLRGIPRSVVLTARREVDLETMRRRNATLSALLLTGAVFVIIAIATMAFLVIGRLG